MAQSFTPKPVRDTQQAAQQAAGQAAAHPVERRWRTIVFQGYLIAALSIFAVLAVASYTTAFFSFDLVVTRGIQSLASPFMTAFMVFISWFGYMPQATIVPILLALVFWFFGFRWEGLMLFVTSVFVATLNLLVKILIQRPRPSATVVDVIQTATGFSFPSGHVMGYVALFGFLLFLAFTLFKRSPLRTLMIAASILMIILVAPSRIYLGDHWFSDTIAAYLLGSLGLTACIAFYRWGKGRFFKTQPAAPEPVDSPSAIPVTARDQGKDRHK